MSNSLDTMLANSGRQDDPLWPRASTLLTSAAMGSALDIAVLGVPTYRNSISPTRANLTPSAIRAALHRYSTWSASGANLSELRWGDFGDIEDPDSDSGEARVTQTVGQLVRNSGLLVALGGDNSLTFGVARGTMESVGKESFGLITLDAHFDLRDGKSNGSPVRRLIDAGLDPKKVAQIGIADFSNSPEYAKRASDLGIRVITREEMRSRTNADIVSEALAITGSFVHLDIDLDVCDRSVVPATPAAAPGGIAAFELRELVRQLCSSRQVKSMDIAEISAPDDSPDGRTVRLGALIVLEAACGFANRSPMHKGS